MSSRLLSEAYAMVVINSNKFLSAKLHMNSKQFVH
jgi:hypothetical protein